MTLFLGLLFGSVGGVYLALARRHHNVTYLVCGFVLIIYPYFFDKAIWIILIGILVGAIPIAQDRGYF
jgi:hypothetical protein